MWGSRVVVGQLVASVSWLLLACLARAEPAGPERVGVGDSRVGYESATYVTRSRRLDHDAGRSADLASLSRNPPLGLPALPEPPGAAEIDLGRRLFFDRRLSANATLSCGMCHVPEQAFTQNELATPVGIEGALVLRNAPSLYNVGYRRSLFHDGRERSLVQQIWAPLLAANEMGNHSRAQVLARLGATDDYREAFAAVYPDGLNARTLGQALAAYQRALLAADSPFDRWHFADNDQALSPKAQRGFELFQASGCASCHLIGPDSALLTDHELHNTGVGYASSVRLAQQPQRLQLAPGVFVPLAVELDLPERSDLGRMEVTGDARDRWKFLTPSLRNVALTAPYMHDGSLATLADVVDFYAAGGGGDPEQDSRVRALELSGDERAALAEFLRSLTGANVDALAADARLAPIGDQR